MTEPLIIECFVECAECGASLTTTESYDNGHIIRVDPCLVCMETSEYEGYQRALSNQPYSTIKGMAK